MRFLKRLRNRVSSKLLSSRKVDKVNFRQTYAKHVGLLRLTYDYPQAMRWAVGGQFEAVGKLESAVLIKFGLKKDGYLIDVGCGSGRLAAPLAQYLTGKYLGIDIVPELVNYARQLSRRPDWRFEVAEGLTIPEQDNAADMVCFFSVFTHLLHEQSYVYLAEARRVLKPGGKIVFSFLDFATLGHWQVFEDTIKNMNTDYPLNVFMGRDAVTAWAAHLGLKVEQIHDGDDPFITLDAPVVFEDGRTVEGPTNFGQSVCVLSRG